MSDKQKPMGNVEKKQRNLAKLKAALAAGGFNDKDGNWHKLPTKANGTVKRADLAKGLGFAKSAFQKVEDKDTGAMIDTEFGVALNEYDLKKTGKSGADWGGNSGAKKDSSADEGTYGANEDSVPSLKRKIARLEMRVGSLKVELEEANQKLAKYEHVESELDNGTVRIPWPGEV